MSRLTKKDISDNYDLTYENGEFVRGIMPNEKVLGEIYINGMNKLGELEDILEEYGVEDLTDLKIALDYYNHRFDGLHTERVGKE